MRSSFTRIILASFFLLTTNHVIADNMLKEAGLCTKLFSFYEKKYKIPSDLLYSIALKESSRHYKKKNVLVVWPWTINFEGKGYYFDSKKEAIAFAEEQLKKGKKNFDVGCMQINMHYHANAFSSIEDAFDPDHNLDYGAKFLKSRHDKLGNWNLAVSNYHSANNKVGEVYSQQVVKILANIDKYKSPFLFFDENQLASKKRYVSPKRILVHDEEKSRKYRSKIMIQVPRKL